MAGGGRRRLFRDRVAPHQAEQLATAALNLTPRQTDSGCARLLFARLTGSNLPALDHRARSAVQLRSPMGSLPALGRRPRRLAGGLALPRQHLLRFSELRTESLHHLGALLGLLTEAIDLALK